MVKKIKKYKKKVNTKRERRNNILFILILLVIVVSVFSTLIILNSVDKAKSFFVSQYRVSAEKPAKIEINILENPDNPISKPVVTSQVTLDILNQEK